MFRSTAQHRAAFVLAQINDILSWEKTKEQERDARFVELGEYLREVRARQFWRMEHLKYAVTDPRLSGILHDMRLERT